MSFGTLYIIDETLRSGLAARESRIDWYHALEELGISNCPSLETEESLEGWELAVEGLDGPLGRLFFGDLAPERSQFADPDAVFLGKELVAAIARELRTRGRVFFEARLHPGWASAIWLYEPLLAHFARAASEGKAMFIFWGG